MRGFPKGLLPAPKKSGGDERTLVEALVREFRAAAPSGEVVLLGHHPAYAGFGLPELSDAPAGVGPIGGLRALLLEAERRGSRALLCGCDLPFVERALFRRFLTEQPDAAALAAKRDGHFEPFPSRFEPAGVLGALDQQLAAGRHSLVALLEAFGACELPLGPGEGRVLRDWDEPSDIEH